MKSSASLWIAVILGLLTLWWVISASTPSTPLQFPQSSCVTGVDSLWLGPWCPYSETPTNAFYLWRPSPLVEALRTVAAPDSRSSWFSVKFYALLLFVGFLFTGLLVSRPATNSAGGTLKKHLQGPFSNNFFIILASLLSTLALVEWVSFDSVALAAIGWVPLLVAAFVAAHHQIRFAPLLAALVCACLALSAHQLTALMLTAACLIAWCCGASFESRVMKRLLAAMLALSALSLLIVPETPLPWYPQGSQVVPDDEIPSMLRPFVGPLPAVPFINRLALKDFFAPTFHALLVALGISMLFAIRRERAFKSLIALVGIPAALVYASLRLPEQISVISPLLVLPRIIPQMFFFPLEHVTLAFGMLGLGVAVLLAGHWRLCIPLAALCFCRSLFPIPEWPVPPAASDSSAWNSTVSFERHQNVLRSPSQFVLQAYHWDALGKDRNWVLERESLIRGAQFTTLTRDLAEVAASHHPEKTRLLFSDRPQARWTAGQGRQRGNEWVHVRLTTPQQLDGAELYLGDYVTDFPRGIRVSAASECPAGLGAEKPQHYRTIIEFPAWYGAVEFSPQGYPYFRGRFSTKLYFPSTEQVQCLLFEQLADSPGTDWSIAKLRILVAPPPAG